MERDEIYLFDLWRVIRREWRWFVGVLIVVLAATFAFTHAARRQWEATAWIQIGQVGQVPAGQDPKVEPFQRVLERLQSTAFKNDVLASIGIAPASAEARLYFKSQKLEPMPYAGPLVKVSVRAYSAAQARQFAEATLDTLRAVHQRIEATPLALARARLDEVQASLSGAIAERDRLQQAAASGSRDDVAGKGSPSPVLASVLVSTRNEEIRNLQLVRSDLVARLSANYTYETSLMWPIYAPENPAFPNLPLSWGLGILLGLAFGTVAAVARGAARRRA
ncbi:Wzz/FepE/Etk N-terminal domain-containing protein [Dyella soli]|uniref:Lipopolysaccharide biosynthesis protein n=1 Tax=Dyella soli TaxID=522319 RepID=A0A4R0YTK1_9GAMM|nr:Wzz/FepE/Etk N-terminal domain-containing protein [Dyella soli]TCI10218.1 lipopolysaccharide biosynthesis protein [Dyella soli]